MSIDEIDFRYWFQLFLNDSIKLYLPSGPPPFSRMVEKNIAHLAIKRCFFHFMNNYNIIYIHLFNYYTFTIFQIFYKSLQYNSIREKNTSCNKEVFLY